MDVDEHVDPTSDDVCLSRSLLLDNERWKQAEVPAEFQDLVNSIADGRISLPQRKIPGTHNPLHTALSGPHQERHNLLLLYPRE